MKRFAVTGIGAAIVVLTLFLAFRQDAPADESLEQRVAALETRVAALEADKGSKSTELPAITDQQGGEGTSIEAHGSSGAVVGPYSLAAGRYRVSFSCGEETGLVQMSDDEDTIVSLLVTNHNPGEEILKAETDLENIFAEISCSADWTLTVAPLK